MTLCHVAVGSFHSRAGNWVWALGLPRRVLSLLKPHCPLKHSTLVTPATEADYACLVIKLLRIEGDGLSSMNQREVLGLHSQILLQVIDLSRGGIVAIIRREDW